MHACTVPTRCATWRACFTAPRASTNRSAAGPHRRLRICVTCSKARRSSTSNSTAGTCRRSGVTPAHHLHVHNAYFGSMHSAHQVRGMNSMFQDANSFDQPIGSWSTSKVENMSYMFHGVEKFNQHLDSWDTSQVWRDTSSPPAPAQCIPSSRACARHCQTPHTRIHTHSSQAAPHDLTLVR